MSDRIALRSLVLGAVFLASPGAGAADWWIETEPLSPAVGQGCALRWMEGGPTEALERGFDGAGFERFQLLWRQGRRNLEGERGSRPASTFRPDTPGVYLLAFSSTAQEGQAGQREFRYGKTIAVVGPARRDDPLRWSELGQRLELVPQSDPVALFEQGGELEVQLLYEREPLAGATLVALRRSAPREGRLVATTDEIGVATFNLDRPGLWLIRAEHGRIRERLTTTLVLAVRAGS